MTKKLLNSITCESIIEALFLLMERKDYKSISITELANKAGVGRASFYRNFKDKDDVIVKYLEEQSVVWAKDLKKPNLTSIDIAESLFTYFKGQERVLKLLYKAGLSHLVLKSIYNVCGPTSEQSNAIAYANACIVGALYMWCDEWIKRGMQESPKEMVNLIVELNNKNLF